jgi:hypothetical protein
MRKMVKRSMPMLAAVLLILAIHAEIASALPLQSWDVKIDSAPSRFLVLRSFDNQAVLDKETQIVWARRPDATPLRTWGTAMNFCLGARYGGRGGWRLPSMEELTSLIDASREFPPLPSGHPFDLSELTGDVWSATTVPGTAEAYTQDMIRDGFLGSLPKTGQRATWCVRGGRGIEGQ